VCQIDLVYRFDPSAGALNPPGTTREAVERLVLGNRDFARLATGTDGLRGRRVIERPPVWFDTASSTGQIPPQTPFAAVLSCSDARVPTEIVFSQPRNSLFIIRVAGNVLGSECLGSIQYAVTHLPGDLRVIVVLGHRSCGAVSAAVDAFLDPASYLDIAPSQALRAVVDRIFVPVRAASRLIREAWGSEIMRQEGYREALIDMSVVSNAALTAWTVRSELPPETRDRIGVVFGVFDLLTHEVWAPGTSESSGVSQGLAEAPVDKESFRGLGRILVQSERLRTLLGV
jgi:carbonic anhydrase